MHKFLLLEIKFTYIFHIPRKQIILEKNTALCVLKIQHLFRIKKSISIRICNTSERNAFFYLLYFVFVAIRTKLCKI